MRTMPTHIDRRGFLVALPALALAPRGIALGAQGAQAAKPQIRTRGINHVKLIVADMKRSIDFYRACSARPCSRASPRATSRSALDRDRSISR